MNILTHNFNFLNGENREIYADLRLVTECGKSLLLHRFVASCVSTKLKKLLEGKLVSVSGVSELPIRNVKFSALENVVTFVYNGKILLSPGCERQDFVDAFNVLQINLGDKINTMIKKLDSHYISDNENSSQEVPELKCTNCDKVFDDKTKLVRHIREIHRKDKVKPKQKYA